MQIQPTECTMKAIYDNQRNGTSAIWVSMRVGKILELLHRLGQRFSNLINL